MLRKISPSLKEIPDMHLGGICFITEKKLTRLDTEDAVASVLKSGLRWIQYREKDKKRREIYEEALRLKRLTDKFNAALIVNDHSDIAMAVDAAGVHLGQDDLPLKEARKILGKKKIIGISTHTLKEAIEAEKGGADYIGFGPMFHTSTKDAGEPKGIAMLREVKRRVKIPLVAIGGINEDNLESVINAGADAVAVASGILKGNISENTKRFLEILYRIKTL